MSGKYSQAFPLYGTSDQRVINLTYHAGGDTLENKKMLKSFLNLARLKSIINEVKISLILLSLCLVSECVIFKIVYQYQFRKKKGLFNMRRTVKLKQQTEGIILYLHIEEICGKNNFGSANLLRDNNFGVNFSQTILFVQIYQRF